MKPDEYQCSICNGAFTKGWSEEEAIAEQKENWPDFDMADCAIVCDDCHQEFMKWYDQQRQGPSG
jgi:hypothetical protein